MNTIGQALQYGISTSRKYWRVLFPFYLITFLIAGMAALPWRSLLYAEAGHSLILGDLVKGFNYTFVNDFLQNYGSALGPLQNLSLLSIALYMLAMVFLTAGLVALLIKAPEQYERGVFWGGGGEYFWRLLRLTLLFAAIHALVLIAFVWLYLKVIKGGSPSQLDNEGIITASLQWIIPLYVIVASFFFMWQDYAKVFLIRQNRTFIWSAVGQSFRWLSRNFKACYGTYVVNMLLLALVFSINHLITSAFIIDSGPTIFVSFLLTQFFLLIRYWLKVFNMGSIVGLIERRLVS